MSLGRQQKNNRTLVWSHTYGDDGNASVTQVLFQMDNAGINPFGWCPGMPSAAKCTRVMVTAQCAADTNPGNWTLRLRKNESLFTDEATFSFALTTALSKTAGAWSAEAIFQPGDTWYVVADGAAKNTVIIRVSMEWEIL